MKVVTIYFNFGNKGGAQNMALAIAKSLVDNDEKPVVLTDTKIEDVHPDYAGLADYRQLNRDNLRQLLKEGYNFISHDRKSTTKLIFWKTMSSHHPKIVHVAHSVFNNLKFFTLFPKKVVAISSAVKDNLVNYFNVPENEITLIFNGIEDVTARQPNDRHGIKILHAGRICGVKRQLEIAEALKGRLPEHISIDFAGVGEDADALTAMVVDESQLNYIGQIDVRERISDYDYIMLFSEKEGLPLSLIEACSAAKPMITNNIAAVKDINEDGVTGYRYDDLDALAEGLQSLPPPDTEIYKQLSFNARKAYESKFTFGRMIEGYKRLLEE